MKNITALFPELNKEKVQNLQNIIIENITLDSREVRQGSLFLAVKGEVVDGRRFIPQALEKGAVAVVKECDVENEHLTVAFEKNIPIIHYFQLPQHLSALAGQFYDEPSKRLQLVGVTGTNGKTTISQLLAQWVELLDCRAAVMGTVGNGLWGKLTEAKNTTGSPLEVQGNLAQFLQQGANFAAIEVSSHGLAQGRIEALQFAAAIFTNLTRDHLDYHGTMENYANAKKRLFSELNTDKKIINADDDMGKQWLKELPEAVAVSCVPDFSTHHQHWIKAAQIQFNAQGVEIAYQSSWGNGKLQSKLIGEFNVSNLLLAFATLLSLGYSLEKLEKTAPHLVGVSGRMEMISSFNCPTAIVDYAHTPDALQKALQAARVHCQGKLICVFGCGGDRDSGKRPLMGQIAEQFADCVIVTDDNPRTEDPKNIVADIFQGFANPEKVQLIHDRKTAIEQALKSAVSNDVVLIAGKGHEDYQIIGKEKQHFSDQETVKAVYKYFKTA